MKHATQFALEKETKGAIRYQELDDKGQPRDPAFCVIGSLYVRKSALGENNKPTKLVVTVEG